MSWHFAVQVSRCLPIKTLKLSDSGPNISANKLSLITSDLEVDFN